MSRDPRLYLDEIIEAVERALRFAEGIQRAACQPGGMAFEAIVRQIEIIGEAAAHLPREVQDQAPDIPWENLIGMRNRLSTDISPLIPTSSRAWSTTSCPPCCPP